MPPAPPTGLAGRCERLRTWCSSPVNLAGSERGGCEAGGQLARSVIGTRIRGGGGGGGNGRGGRTGRGAPLLRHIWCERAMCGAKMRVAGPHPSHSDSPFRHSMQCSPTSCRPPQWRRIVSRSQSQGGWHLALESLALPGGCGCSPAAGQNMADTFFSATLTPTLGTAQCSIAIPPGQLLRVSSISAQGCPAQVRRAAAARRRPAALLPGCGLQLLQQIWQLYL